jgi:CO/xanthine dehydrogenase Mo-binding subunit
MERIAAELGIDPLELRRLNMLRQGDTTATGQQLKWSVGSEDVLQAAVEQSAYLQQRLTISQTDSAIEGSPSSTQVQGKIAFDDRKRRGIGLSFFFHGAGFTGSGEARMKAQAGVEITPEGRPRILSSSTEIGQGTRTIFSQIVADELTLKFDDVEMAEADTSRVPDSGPTVASRTCMVVGRVVQLAARDLKEKLLRFVGERFAAPEAALHDGEFVANGKPLAGFQEMASEYRKLFGELRGTAQYASPPGIEWDDDTYSGDAYPV